MPPTILPILSFLYCAADVARLQELLVALAAHLRAHLVEAVAGRRADLEHGVDVHAGLDQALEVALADQVLLLVRKLEPRHECFFVALEGLALGGRAERLAHPVQPAAAPRQAQVEDGGVGDQPQTSLAVSRHSRSLAFSCSTVRLLPWWVLEKPHCGERHRLCIGTNLAACSILFFSRSLDSSWGSLDETSPSTTFFPFGM